MRIFLAPIRGMALTHHMALTHGITPKVTHTDPTHGMVLPYHMAMTHGVALAHHMDPTLCMVLTLILILGRTHFLALVMVWH